MHYDLTDKVYEEISKLPLYDVHTHMDSRHLSARGLHDVLLYHMVISDLYSSGCPDGARLSEMPDRTEVESRIERALPYLGNIQNTNSFWGVRLILKDLYGWDKPITADNWREVDALISEKSGDSAFERGILKKAGIQRSCTELWRRFDGSGDDVLQYSLEWAFFARTQYGRHDTALIELEYSWNMETPGPPLPVTADLASMHFAKKIRSVADVKAAMKHFIDTIPKEDVINAASHISTDIHYRPVSETEMEQAILRRDHAGAVEQEIYANYINAMYIDMMTRQRPDILLQFSIGAEPLPYETGSKLHTHTMYELVDIFRKYPDRKFVFHVASLHQNQAFSTIAKELPNVYLAGYWWHCFYPYAISSLFEQRLEMLPMNKQFIFFSDAYCADWAYAKSVIVKKQIAQVMAGKIQQGQFTLDQVLDMLGRMFAEIPEKELGMIKGDF